MSLLRDQDKEKLRGIFKNLQNEVKLVMFTQEFECDSCRVTRELLEELAKLSDKIRLEVRDFVQEADLAKKYGVDKIPAILLLGDRDYGIRFYGIPSGYEFSALIEDILDVSRREARLPAEVMGELAKVDRPVHMQVIISPTCPYCPQAVRTAHQFAMSSPHVKADMVETSEFPYLTVKYHVHGVPHTIINETYGIIGAQPEIEFARKILEAIGK